MKKSFCARLMRAALLGSVATSTRLATLPASAATTPDGVTPASVVDTANTQPYWVGLAIRNEAGNSGGTCTGLLINPRTVLFAAHCVDSVTPGNYDAPTSPGNRAQVGYTTDPTFGRTNLREFLFGLDFAVPAGDARVVNGSSVMVWYDPRSRFGSAAIPANGTFLPADVAIAAFDTPNELLGRDAINGMGLLFSPVTGPVPIRIGGYGQSGNGFDGTRTSGSAEESFYRRLVNNTLGFLGDERSLAQGIYPAATADLLEPPGLVYQDLYWADFDDPQRATRPFFNGPGSDPLCAGSNPNCRLDHDPFTGAAVAGEGITAAGDSGSPLATSAFGRTVSLGVLSQGSRFFYESIGNPDDNFVRFTGFSNFGTVAGYNPLFLFWDQIVVNNPYKYVTTTAGDGEWTDASRWVQELDPLYMVLAGSTLVNGLPSTPALGVSNAAANFGSITPSPSPAATCAFLGTCPPTGGTSEPAPGAVGLPGQEDMAGTVNLTDKGGDGNPEVLDPNAEAINVGDGDPQVLDPVAEALVAGNPTSSTSSDTTQPGNPPSEPMTTAAWSSGTLIPVNSGTLTGPGTTNFVPNNTNGTAGIQNSTRFFEVNLRSAGTTFLTGTTVTIDRLNVRGANSGLHIRSGAQLNTTISSYVDAGTLTVNGGFSTTNLFVLGGKVMGAGTITGNVLNTNAVVAPGNSIGTLNIVGNYTQGPTSLLDIEMTAGSSDVLAVTGNAQLAGTVRFTQFGAAPTLGQTSTFLTTGGTVSGRFSAFQDLIPGALFPVLTYGNNFVSVTIANFCSFASGPVETEVCATLDSSAVQSDPDMASAISGLQLLDSAQLSQALEALSPTRANAQATIAFTSGDLLRSQLSQRVGTVLGGASPGGVAQMDLARTQLASAAPSAEALASAAAAALAASTAGTSDIVLENGYGVFFAGDFAISETDQAGGIGTDKGDTAALTIGLDHSDGQGLVAGVAASYLQSQVAQDYGLGGHTSSDGIALSAFASMDRGALSAEAYASGAWHSFETERTLLLAPFIKGIASGETDASQIQAGASVAYDLLRGERLSLGAVGGLHYVNVDIDAYTETGVGALGAAVSARSADSLRSQLGGELALHLDPTTALVVPMLRVVWNHEFMDDPLAVTSAFAGAPGVTFQAPGPDLGTDWATVGFGVSGRVSADTNFYLRVQKDIGRDGAERHEVSAAARFGF